MIHLREAREEDGAWLARRLREADRNELCAISDEDPEYTLFQGIRSSVPCRAVVDHLDKPVALFGVNPDGPDSETGLVWLLGTDELSRYSYVFLRHCLRELEDLHRHYSLLWNFVDARNHLHLRWLMWAGFRKVRAVPAYGREKRRFFLVARESHGGDPSAHWDFDAIADL